MKRSGTADLPLHGGTVPTWLSARMTELGREIVSAIVYDYGPSAFLSRLSDPFWFQALGCVLGMDWHSSGITTSVMGALKRGLNPVAHELGIFVCGGRGKHSLKTPQELMDLSDHRGLNGTELVHASKLSAKVDNTCVQDGFGLYLHSFIVTKEGEWAVVQQGMNQKTGWARRYHWHSPTVRTFIDNPHTAVMGKNIGAITNLSDSRAADNRNGIVEFLRLHPDKQKKEFRHLAMARPHQVTPRHVDSKRLGAVLASAYEKQFESFTDALLLKGVGPRTIQSLALVSEIIHGAPHRFDDPARFSFAHGGKDGAPFPVPLKTYDESIGVLKNAVNKAKIGQSDRARGLKKLSKLSYFIENNFAPGADVKKVIAHERKHSHEFGGMTVKGPVQAPRKSKAGAQQLSLFD
ncbi:MAG: DUF763 domain-containing protein [Chitinivibrionales bacterium]|nr:DUF763 domain-containing protein [Chitinivibrionales bacterium]